MPKMKKLYFNDLKLQAVWIVLFSGFFCNIKCHILQASLSDFIHE